jgi:hypothetical protein
MVAARKQSTVKGDANVTAGEENAEVVPVQLSHKKRASRLRRELRKTSGKLNRARAKNERLRTKKPVFKAATSVFTICPEIDTSHLMFRNTSVYNMIKGSMEALLGKNEYGEAVGCVTAGARSSIRAYISYKISHLIRTAFKMNVTLRKRVVLDRACIVLGSAACNLPTPGMPYNIAVRLLAQHDKKRLKYDEKLRLADCRVQNINKSHHERVNNAMAVYAQLKAADEPVDVLNKARQTISNRQASLEAVHTKGKRRIRRVELFIERLEATKVEALYKVSSLAAHKKEVQNFPSDVLLAKLVFPKELELNQAAVVSPEGQSAKITDTDKTTNSSLIKDPTSNLSVTEQS